MNQIVADFASCENQIDSFFAGRKIGRLLKRCNVVKSGGVAPVAVMRFIFALVFAGKNLFRYLEAAQSDREMSKDTVYRFLNSLHANWRRFLHLLSAGVIEEFLPLTSKETVKAFIVDDSPYSRDRSKVVELLARVFDHNEKRYFRGFRLLTLGWSDGISHVPVSFSLLSSAKEKNRLAPMRDGIDKRTNGFERRRESVMKATDALARMISQAKGSGIHADYILFDSWFAFPAVIMKLLATGMHTVCMLKAMENVRYLYQGKAMNLNALYRSVRKKAGKARILASAVVEIGKDDDGKPIPAKVVFVRNRVSKGWLALLCTDLALPDEEVVRLYKRRWDIEVFFKMIKSHLNLAKEFQCRSYDALVAHTTIVFCRYIMLALAQRANNDPRGMGSLFHAGCDEMRQTTFLEALQMMISILQEKLRAVAGLAEKHIQSLMETFLADLPALLRRVLLIPASKLAAPQGGSTR